MKWPSIDQTRAYFQMFSAAVLIVILVYMLISGRGEVDTIVRILLALLGAGNLINGIGLHQKERNGNGNGTHPT